MGGHEISNNDARAVLAGDHAFGLDDGSGGGENQFLLQFSGEWARQFDAGGDQHVDQKYPEIGLALRDGRSERNNKVEWRARCDLFDQVGSGVEVNGKFVTGGALELGA